MSYTNDAVKELCDILRSSKVEQKRGAAFFEDGACCALGAMVIGLGYTPVFNGEGISAKAIKPTLWNKITRKKPTTVGVIINDYILDHGIAQDICNRVVTLNDTLRKSFPEIADTIEQEFVK